LPIIILKYISNFTLAFKLLLT